MVAEKVAQKEEEMKQVMDEKIRIYKETEHVLSRQVSHFKDQLAMLQTNHEVTQAKLVDETQKYDEGVAARLAELDIVLMDLERSNAKIVQLERETRLLKDQMNAPRDESENEILIKQQHERIREVEAENAEIAQKLDEALSAQRDAEYGAVQRIADLERDVASKSFEIAQMQARLAEFSDYDEIKRELDIIKGIEFDGFVDSEAPAAALDYPIERLLVAKNKKLQSDVMALKAELFEATSMLQECKDARAHAEHLLGESKALVAKLEGDLLRINESWASTATANTPSRRQTMSEGLESLMSDSLAKAAASELPSSVAVGPVGGLASAIGAGSSAEPSAVHEARPLVTSTDASIVPILTSQRDRYKRRFEELEQTTREQNQTLSDLRYEIANLKSDNVKLYEKLRYAETYSAARSQTQARGVSHSIINMGTADRRAAASDADAISSKYRGIYEESLDPFKQFHRQEEQRRFHSMNPAERAALSLTRLLSTNRYSRWIFVIYSAALHLLVFVTLYQLSLADCPTALPARRYIAEQQ
nr:hypothetical protein HK105_003787 [Polyrhizophydium stewartii]